MRAPLSGVHAVCIGCVGVQVHRVSWATARADEARRDEMYRTVDGMTR